MNQMARALHDLIADRQHNRILRLSFPRNDAPRAQFVVNRLDAEESISRDFEFTVELLSSEPNVPLKEMQGKLLTVGLVQQGGSLRYFSGYVFSFRKKKSDGGTTFYEAKLGPWLKYLSLRRNCYLFHELSLREQTDFIFRSYPVYAKWDWFVGYADAMTEACQFEESDFNYLSRRWEDAGILYWYEHSATGHQLVLSDHSIRAKPIDGEPAIRFQRDGGSAEEDAIDQWSPVRHAVPTSSVVIGFDFKAPRPTEVGVPTINKQGILPSVESFEYLGAYGCKNFNDGDRISRLRMEEMEAAGRYFDGEGNNRSMLPGRSFFLTDHFAGSRLRGDPPGQKDEYLILTLRHTASNNYLQRDESVPLYRNSFSCIRKMIPWRPGRGFNSTATRILAPQTATVVGMPGQDSICTDEFGRIRIQFHWDRIGKNDQASSAWVRVASGWAGAELGAAAVPRVGSEVIVQWLDGNPDRPIVTGSIHNAHHMPPWKLPHQRALTGLRSRELIPGEGNYARGRSNHLILDDTHQRIQAQLKSDHQQSQLSLGFINRIEGNSGRQQAGGEGWEIATSAWGVARAERGMLLSTEAVSSATPEAKDLGGALQRLVTAQDEHAALAGMAENAKAQEAGQQAAIATAIEQQNNSIRGGSGDFPELSEPQIVVASPSGIALSSAGNLHIASASSVALTTRKSLAIAGSDLFASVANTFRLFVHKAGMKLIAASGKVEIQAQRDELEVLANKVLTLISETDWVDIKGRKGVRLHGADCMIEIGDKVQVFTSSPTLFHGNLQTLAPKTISQHFNERPTSRFDQEVNFVGPDKRPVKDVEYEIHRDDGSVFDGKTAASGTTGVQKSTGMDSYTIRYKGELP